MYTSRMILIGLTGAIGHGKSTFAEALLTQVQPSLHLESSTLIAAVGNELSTQSVIYPNPSDLKQINKWMEQLPDILKKTVGIQANFSQIFISEESWQSQPVEYEKLIIHLRNLRAKPELFREPVQAHNKNLYRPLLQWLGGYLMQHIDTGIWYDTLIRQAQAAEKKGCRLCVIGGLRFPTDAKRVRDAGGTIVSVKRPHMGESDILDPTERERRKIHIDTTVINGGSLSNLSISAQQLVYDITQRTLLKEYGTLTT